MYIGVIIKIGDDMKALITGASSGIGKDMAIYLSNLGYDLVLVARTKSKLNEVAKLCKTKTKLYNIDLTEKDNCIKLFNENKDIDILVNNAGYGIFGEFKETDLNKELDMINLNINALHILTKLYLKEMIKKDSGKILNVASSAAFLPGPLMSGYYSTKSYVYSLTMAIYEELRQIKSNVSVHVLCPGPVDTNFNDRAGVSFAVKALKSDYVATYAINKMFKGKLVIVPGFLNRLAKFMCNIVPLKILLRVDYNIQKKKEN